MEVLGEGRGEWRWMWMGVWGIPLASKAGSGCPSLSRGGMGRKGSSNGSGDRLHPPLPLW
jgi:hypothetical protein